MKNLITKAIASLALMVSLVAPASALSTFDVNAVLGNGTVVAGNTPNLFDYKFDVPASESGDLADLLSTTIINGVTALVVWSPIGSMDIDAIYLKAANSYIFWDTTGVDWSTYDSFQVTNTQIKNRNGVAQGISHVQLDGTYTPPGVPDSGTSAILVGLGLIALGLFRRQVK